MKQTDSKLNRREFARVAATAAALCALPSATVAAAATSASGKNRYKYCAFIKYLLPLKYDELTNAIADAGFDGVEVTARKTQAYIHPHNAAEELERLKEALAKRDLEITILTTDILRADEPDAEPMLRAAAKLGITRYRLGFFRYDLNEPILPQVDALEPVIRDIAAMNREIGIAGMWQNHSGAPMVGATVWDMLHLIKDYPVSELGCVFDIRHAATEAGEAWPVYYDLMKPHIIAMSSKDFRWDGRKNIHVPLGKGNVDPKFYKSMVRKSDFHGPISVHVEYLPKGSAQDNVTALKTDFATLRGWTEA